MHLSLLLLYLISSALSTTQPEANSPYIGLSLSSRTITLASHDGTDTVVLAQWQANLAYRTWFAEAISQHLVHEAVDATVVVFEVFNQAEEILNVKLGEEKAYITAVSVPFPISTRRLEIEMLAAVEGLSFWDNRTGFPSAILETKQILWSAYDLGVEGMVDESREGAGAGVVVNIEVNWVCSGMQVLGVEEGVVWVIGEDVWLDLGWRKDDGGEHEESGLTLRQDATWVTNVEGRFERFFAQYFISTSSMREGDKYASEQLRMITFTGDAPAHAFALVRGALGRLLANYPWVVFKEDFKPDEISAIGAAMLGKVLAEEEARYESDYMVDMTKFQDT
ncbi:hypothetical protein D6C86_09570 [Aureobasidium pullulans]|uniref:Uncharacterized protein n=1 Tax=Aureobasidium pullulans TaxID=5580 RepID=A0A4S9V5D2_AURPU|nr:hypothetical protein D6C94_05159 [Aureobasidium pullulans]THZ46779.1 hypothetical protein D6C87_01939 [Aureobasidium pullulans]THZ54139.1 hypothetical protein D6C86_09570 [Aureobasidium pullulans]THZ84327.1 hypothetical protein D6C88_05784 [Aureobasidium pullulans]